MEIDFKLIDLIIKKVKEIYEKSKKITDINITNKEGNDIVTTIDLYMENEIINFIKEIFPNHSIYSEECGESPKESEYEWFIDPIDGTINFACGIPLFSTSIALKKNDEIILGIIFDYNQNEVYYALKGNGAYCNGKKISVSNNTQLKDSVISFCLTSHYNQNHIDDVLYAEKQLADKVRGLRLIVTAAIELCWIASGKTDGMFNVKPSIGLSSAAGKLLVKEAGGMISNIYGEERNKVDTLAVSNGKIHNELIEKLNFNNKGE